MHISNQILELTKAIHAMSTGQSDGSANQAGNEVDPASYDRRTKQVGKQGVGEHRAPGIRRARTVVSDTW